jgi:hypothetical protein
MTISYMSRQHMIIWDYHCWPTSASKMAAQMLSGMNRIKQIAADKMRGDSKQKYCSNVPEHMQVQDRLTGSSSCS